MKSFHEAFKNRPPDVNLAGFLAKLTISNIFKTHTMEKDLIIGMLFKKAYEKIVAEIIAKRYMKAAFNTGIVIEDEDGKQYILAIAAIEKTPDEPEDDELPDNGRIAI